MTLALRDIRDCLEGIIPATIVTANNDGVPNIVTLSKVDYVDDEHVALSRQFFRKTAKNLQDNPCACVLVSDPTTYVSYRLYVRFERSETEGPIFERMRLRIETIASLMGMEEVFCLQAADIFRVESIEEAKTTMP